MESLWQESTIFNTIPSGSVILLRVIRMEENAQIKARLPDGHVTTLECNGDDTLRVLHVMLESHVGDSVTVLRRFC
jgi:hypothetical protein